MEMEREHFVFVYSFIALVWVLMLLVALWLRRSIRQKLLHLNSCCDDENCCCSGFHLLYRDVFRCPAGETVQAVVAGGCATTWVLTLAIVFRALAVAFNPSQAVFTSSLSLLKQSPHYVLLALPVFPFVFHEELSLFAWEKKRGEEGLPIKFIEKVTTMSTAGGLCMLLWLSDAPSNVVFSASAAFVVALSIVFAIRSERAAVAENPFRVQRTPREIPNLSSCGLGSSPALWKCFALRLIVTLCMMPAAHAQGAVDQTPVLHVASVLTFLLVGAVVGCLEVWLLLDVEENHSAWWTRSFTGPLLACGTAMLLHTLIALCSSYDSTAVYTLYEEDIPSWLPVGLQQWFYGIVAAAASRVATTRFVDFLYRDLAIP